MKKVAILFSFAALVAAPFLIFAAVGDDSSIIELEKKAWDAFKNRQGAAFQAFYTSDYTGVYGDGMKDIKGEVADMNNSDILSLTFSDMHVTHPAQDVAIVIYKADLQGTYKGKDVSGRYNCSGVWMNNGGKWLCPLHTEAKAGAP